MKKVLFLSNHFVTVYNFRKELIAKFVNEEFEVIMVLPYSEDVHKLNEMGCKCIFVEVDRRSLNPFKDLLLLINYMKIIRITKPDFILSFTIKPNIYGGTAARLLSIPFFSFVTGLGSTFYNNQLMKKIVIQLYKGALKKSIKVFFENEGDSGIFTSNKIIKQSQSSVMNGAGVNLDEYKFDEMNDTGKRTFLFIGRIMKEKGVGELFNVIKQIKEEYSTVEFNFIGWFEEDYKQIIETMQREGLISYFGFQKDVKPFIRQSHCIILPSYHEGLSNTLLEGAAIGRPLITSNIHGCKETVVDGVSGFLCNVKETDDLYFKIKKFIELPFEEIKQMGERSREHVEKHFNKKFVVEETINIIKGELSGKH
jgi:glycosyltransferase involved in cell wall biosynthesis